MHTSDRLMYAAESVWCAVSKWSDHSRSNARTACASPATRFHITPITLTFSRSNLVILSAIGDPE
eukprot:44490-Rhodomonas_salina.1